MTIIASRLRARIHEAAAPAGNQDSGPHIFAIRRIRLLVP